MLRVGLLSLLVLPAICSGATEWTYGSSDHFEVYTTGGAGKARETLNYFERIHAFYADVLKADPERKAPTRIVLFSNVKEYTPFRPNEGAFAFYQPGPDRDYVVMQSLTEQAYQVVVHEYMHLIVRHLIKTPLPVWLNEGWADFYSTVEPKAGKMAVGGIPAGRLYQVTQFKMMPLEKLFAVTHSSPEYNDKKLMGEFYAQSWALVHMMIASKDYSPGAPKFFQLMLAGKDAASAIKEAWDVPLAKMYKDLDAYVRVGSYLLRLYDYKSPKARKDLEVRPATPFEGKLMTANLHAASPSGADEARAAFAEMEGEKPEDLELQESIAAFEYRRGKPEAAIPHYAKAAALGSKNWQMYRDYAYASQDSGKRADLLGKAVQLNDRDLEVRLRWCGALLQANRPAQAVAALVPVTNIDREHAFEFFELSANANLRVDRLADAKRDAEKAVEYSDKADQRTYAQQLLASVVKRMEYAEQVKKYEEDQKRYAERLGNASEPARETLGAPDAERPRLTRAAPVERPRPITDEEVAAINQAVIINHSDIVVEAKWQQIDCAAAQPVMVFLTDSGTLRLSLNQPNNILLKGAGAATINISCGDQKNRPVRVGYKKEPDAARRTAGDVRYLELQ